MKGLGVCLGLAGRWRPWRACRVGLLSRQQEGWRTAWRPLAGSEPPLPAVGRGPRCPIQSQVTPGHGGVAVGRHRCLLLRVMTSRGSVMHLKSLRKLCLKLTPPLPGLPHHSE